MSLHWNGTAWTPIAVPIPVGAAARLTRVAALGPHEVLALGSLRTESDDNSRWHPWLVRWNGTAWTTVTDVPGLVEGRTLADLDVAAPDTVVAVGYQEMEDGSDRPWSLHWNGAAWRTAWGWNRRRPQ